MTSRLAIGSAALSTALFVGLSFLATTTELFPGERSVTRWLIANVEEWLRPVSKALDATFTDLSATVVFVVLAPVVVARWGRWTGAAFLLAGAATGITRVASVVERPRPYGDLEWGAVVSGKGGYPSGHVVYMMLVCGSLASFTGPDRTGSGRALSAILWTIIVLTGVSRVLVLDHWPVDVVGGYLLAWPVLVGVVYLHRVAPGRLRTVRARLDGGPN